MIQLSVTKNTPLLTVKWVLSDELEKLSALSWEILEEISFNDLPKSQSTLCVFDFNMKPIKKGAGSAIFLHLSDKNFKYTKGCIAIKKKDFLRVLSRISKKTLLQIN